MTPTQHIPPPKELTYPLKIDGTQTRYTIKIWGNSWRLPYPIGSMYGIFTYIWLILMVNVGKHANPMDPMDIFVACLIPSGNLVIEYCFSLKLDRTVSGDLLERATSTPKPRKSWMPSLPAEGGVAQLNKNQVSTSIWFERCVYNKNVLYINIIYIYIFFSI